MYWIFAAFLLGLAGSTHCLGMCGPLVLAMPFGNGKTRTIRMLVYHFMRAIMYALMGLIIGVLGIGFHLAGWQSPISIAAGLMVVVIGIWQLMGRGKFKININIPGVNQLRTKLIRQTGGPLRNALLGFINGLLPCGLVYTALAASIAAGGIWQSSVFMFVFGTATLPALFVLGWLPQLFPKFTGQQLYRVIPIVTIIVGLLFILRGMELGIPYLSPPSEVLSVENPGCCSKPQP
ncbi:MAG: sulfite exporter TauE/SafE family protein [Cryomorphaceae bacterium]|nr:sulfite exporter TauE/SafE family protein [Cryomorphaceae bacterium]